MTEKPEGHAVALSISILSAVLLFGGLVWLLYGYGFGSGILVGIIAFISSMTARHVYAWLKD